MEIRRDRTYTSGKWCAEIFAKDMRRLRIDEAATMPNGTNGARIVAFHQMERH
jgi:hypothetical protein